MTTAEIDNSAVRAAGPVDAATGDGDLSGEQCATCGQPVGRWQRDRLTGLLDRWGWDEQAGRTLSRAQLTGASIALLLLDLDRFKAVNDDLGHLAGDAVLASVAAVLRRATGSDDLIGRYGGHGGDEFLVLLPDTDEDRACRVADRIRCDIAALTITVPTTSLATASLTGITASAGVAVAPAAPDLALTDFVLAADAALQGAKRGGRNGIRSVPVAACAARAPLAADDDGRDVPVAADHPGHLLDLARLLSGHGVPEVLVGLAGGPQRFADLLATVRTAEGWSSRPRHAQDDALHRTLRAMERDGLVWRFEGAVEIWYELTGAANRLLAAVTPGALWCRDNENLIRPRLLDRHLSAVAAR